ncbi:hypothetical protein HKD37_15G042596 [Glycine soja]
MANFGLSNFNTNKFPIPIETSVIDTQMHFAGSNNSYSYNMDQFSEKVKNYNRYEVQEKISMMNPPKRSNINFSPLVNHGIEMLQKKEALFSTKNAKLEAIDAIAVKDEGKKMLLP